MPSHGAFDEAAPPRLPRDDFSGETLRTLPQRLWNDIRADPLRAPERIALAAAEVHGPAAAKWVADRQRTYGADGDHLAKIAKRKHAALTRWSGAATGLGGWWTMAPDMAVLIWLEARMIFYIAASYGYDPRDPMRPAELLTLFEVYPDPLTAREALDGIGPVMATALVDRQLRGSSREQTLVFRLGAMATRKGVEKLAGKAVPFFASFYNAIDNERQTRALARAAIKFYKPD